MKKPQHLKNKKGQLYQEAILTIFAVLIIFGCIYIGFKTTYSSKKDIEQIDITIPSQFPAVFTHSFLMTTIKSEDLPNLPEFKKQKTYYIKDLMKVESDETEQVIKDYKKTYLESYTTGDDNPLENYKKAENTNTDSEELLCLSYSDQNSKDLDYEIANKNYFFYLKTTEGTYAIMQFKC